MFVKIIPDLTILEQGTGPATDVWPDSAAGGGGASAVGTGTAFGQVYTTLGPPGTPTSLPLTAEWISPTNNPTWTQATWFVDPANSTGLASDLNSGIDALHPVLSFNGGVVAKWGTNEPLLSQNTALTWLSSNPAGVYDPVVFRPFIGATAGTSALINVFGTLGAALTSGALTGVLAKNRSTTQRLTANLGAVVPLGSLVQNMTAGKFSTSVVYSLVSGTTYILTQPLSTTVLPLSQYGGTPRTEVDTWANGDTFSVFAPTQIDLMLIGAQAIDQLDLAAGVPPPIQVQYVRAQSINGFGFKSFRVTQGLVFADCVFDASAQLDRIPTNVTNIQSGTVAFGGIYDEPASETPGVLDPLWQGGAIATGPAGGSSFSGSIINDTYIDAIVAVITIGGQTIPSMGDVCLVGGVVAVIGGVGMQELPGLFWGNGTLDLIGRARVTYSSAAGGATATFLNAVAPATGALKINLDPTANPFSKAAGTWQPAITITPAALDAAYGPAGFGGLAVNVGGGAFTNQPGT